MRGRAANGRVDAIESARKAELLVTQFSGEELPLMTHAEVRWFNTNRDMYREQTKFTETTDLLDLDRLLIQELMIYRMSQWLASGSDYDGFEIDETMLRRNMREMSEQITRLKSSMGLTKSARDEAANTGDLSSYITNLKVRARIFGVHREKQLTRALVLMNELSAIVGAFDRSDAEERTKIGFESEKDILDWVRNTMLSEFKELDAHFRANQQRYWIREM